MVRKEKVVVLYTFRFGMYLLLDLGDKGSTKGSTKAGINHYDHFALRGRRYR